MAKRALVVGGTGGIGYAIACRVAADSAFTNVVISGRNKPSIIPYENMEFRQLDASSMRSIKRYTDAHKSTPDQNLDLLVLTQGIFTLAGRTETSEGIDRKMALHYYGRQLLIRELEPVLKDDAKVLIVLDGTRGTPVGLHWDDLDLKTHFSLSNAAHHCLSMTDAMVQVYAGQEKEKNGGKRHFVHAFPGAVKTDIVAKGPWYQRVGMNALLSIIGVTPQVSAENMVKGTYDRAEEREKEGVFWSCIDDKGRLVPNKVIWDTEQMKKVVDHTWKTVDEAIGKQDD